MIYFDFNTLLMTGSSFGKILWKCHHECMTIHIPGVTREHMISFIYVSCLHSESLLKLFSYMIFESRGSTV